MCSHLLACGHLLRVITYQQLWVTKHRFGTMREGTSLTSLVALTLESSQAARVPRIGEEMWRLVV